MGCVGGCSVVVVVVVVCVVVVFGCGVSKLWSFVSFACK